MSYFKSIFHQLLQQLVSCNCLVCDAIEVRNNGLCSDCENELPWQAPGCLRCGVVPSNNEGNEIVDINRAITNFVCHRCEAAPPTFDRCTTLFAYEGPVPDMIKRFKDRASFSDYRCLSRLLCHQFHHYYANEPVATPDFLIPVPMHNSRIRWRGFNQSVMLTRFLSRHTGVPTLLQGCQRLPTLRAQRGLNARQRLGNMPQMFTPGPHASRLSGCNLAIIDDVVTTTATAQAMAGVLKDCGASSIHVWALARVNL